MQPGRRYVLRRRRDRRLRGLDLKTGCSVGAALAGSEVQVTLADMRVNHMGGGADLMGARMALRGLPASVPAGTVSMVASNVGALTHELVVLPLPRGGVAGQRVTGSDGMVDESDSLGEASRSCAMGPGDGIEAGTAGGITMTLVPGRYELICNLPQHYADGMHQELDVH